MSSLAARERWGRLTWLWQVGRPCALNGGTSARISGAAYVGALARRTPQKYQPLPFGDGKRAIYGTPSRIGGVPLELFDFIVIYASHRSIRNLWRQVLEYFDAFLIGLTTTPSKQTFGFFNQNLVMEYNHEQAWPM